MVQKMNTANFEFKLSGFVIALIVISLLASSMGIFITGMQTEYDVQGNHSLSNYNKTGELSANIQEIRDETNIDPKEGWIDIIGGYLQQGYAAVKISKDSFDLFSDMTNAKDGIGSEATFISYFNLNTFLYLIIMVGIFIGVFISILVKMRQ